MRLYDPPEVRFLHRPEGVATVVALSAAALVGVIAWLVRWYRPQAVRFDDSFRDQFGLTISSEAMDRQFLAELGWRIATRPAMPAYHEDEQFARPRVTATR